MGKAYDRLIYNPHVPLHETSQTQAVRKLSARFPYCEI